MDDFNYRAGRLYAEDVPAETIAGRVGTPCYVYSAATLRRHARAVEEAFQGYPHVACFALKANSNGAVLRVLAGEGLGADIVSGGELYRARRAGIPGKKIVYAGVGKSDDEIRAALRARILQFNIESEEELRRIDSIAGEMGKKAPIALRVSPDIDAGTHPYITTGLAKYKFGLPIEQAFEGYRLARKLRHTEIVGIHKHIGSQLTEIEPFVASTERIVHFIERLRDEGIVLRYMDIGGGLGITYNNEAPPLPRELMDSLIPLIEPTGCTLITEPGRSVAGNAGVLLTRVRFIKKTASKTFAIVDAGMNDLCRPSLYKAFHRIEPVRKTRRGPGGPVDVVGPICETGDFLALDRDMPRLKAGDLLAVFSAGAYGFTMSSNYNSRPRVAEVLVDGGRFAVVGKRERYADLVRHESIPSFVK